MDNIGHFVERPNPELRHNLGDVYDLGLKKHYMTAILEIDVTEARKGVRAYRRSTGHGLSFTAWFLKCIAQAVSEYPEVQAMRKSRKSLILFDDVDISLPIERQLGDDRVPMLLVLRRVNEKALQQIHDEIEQAKHKTVEDEVVLDDRKNQRLLRLASKLPKTVRVAWWKSVIKNPLKAKATMGTVAVTSVSMFGKADAWGIPISIHPLCFALGSLTTKPGVVRGSVMPREFLNLTVLFDHDVVDGGPAARFLARLDELVRNAHGLPRPTQRSSSV